MSRGDMKKIKFITIEQKKGNLNRPFSNIGLVRN